MKHAHIGRHAAFPMLVIALALAGSLFAVDTAAAGSPPAFGTMPAMPQANPQTTLGGVWGVLVPGNYRLPSIQVVIMPPPSPVAPRPASDAHFTVETVHDVVITRGPLER